MTKTVCIIPSKSKVDGVLEISLFVLAVFKQFGLSLATYPFSFRKKLTSLCTVVYIYSYIAFLCGYNICPRIFDLCFMPLTICLRRQTVSAIKIQ